MSELGNVHSVSAQAELPACPCPLWIAVCFGDKKMSLVLCRCRDFPRDEESPGSRGCATDIPATTEGDAPGGAAGSLPRSSCRKLEEPWGYSGKH